MWGERVFIEWRLASQGSKSFSGQDTTILPDCILFLYFNLLLQITSVFFLCEASFFMGKLLKYHCMTIRVNIYTIS